MMALGPQGEDAFLQISRAITQAELPVRRVSQWMDKLWATMKNTIRWQFTSRAWMTLLSSIRTAYSYSQDLNESLTKIRIVTGHNADEMARFAENANKAAAKLNTTTTEYTDASRIYFQQGLDDAEVERRTAITIKLANAAGISVEQASHMTDEDFKTNTVFYCYPSSMNSTNITLLVRGAHLALGIPALAPATGRSGLSSKLGSTRNTDLNVPEEFNGGVERPNGWPIHSTYSGQWLHSDIKDVSYFFNFKFYQKIKSQGGLQ